MRTKRVKNVPVLNKDEAVKISIPSQLPLEHVFRTNINCRHDPGSNRYYFEYPGTIRTIANQQLLIGIRAMYIKTSFDRVMMLDLKHYDGTNPKPTFSYTYLYAINLGSRSFINDICTDINNKIEDHVYPKTNLRIGFAPSIFQDELIILQAKWSSVIKGYYEITNMSDDFINAFGIIDTIISFKDENKKSYPIKWGCNYDELEVTASFVNQTELQHLGYTGISFNPLKYYKINSTDKEFYIELWGKEGILPAPLPDDNRDSVIIEAQFSLLSPA